VAKATDPLKQKLQYSMFQTASRVQASSSGCSKPDSAAKEGGGQQRYTRFRGRGVMGVVVLAVFCKCVGFSV